MIYLITFVVVGIALNLVILVKETNRSPEGFMGAGVYLLLALVPWLFVGVVAWDEIRTRFR